jgi:adenosylcobinamide-GDP ribazoletransferase
VPESGHGRALLGAVGFLTRLPVRHEPLTASEFANSAVLFPLIGAALGGAIGGIALGLAQLLPALLAAMLAIAFELVITGALHVDGLADSADGLGGRNPERAREIMRDHTLGAYGASALVLDLVAKAAALGALVEAGNAVLPVVAAYAISRAAPLPLALTLRYARPDGGTGRSLVEGLGFRGAAAGIVLATFIAVVTTGAWALGALACLGLVGTAIGVLARRLLGGVTGDTMGAAIELTATSALIFAAAWSA